MAEIGRLLRTVSRLAPSQVWHRLRLTARRKHWERQPERIDARYRDRAGALPPARFDDPGLARVAEFRTRHRVGALLRTADDALEGRFTFLDRTIDFGNDVDWYRSDLDVGTRLWKTHLHEFPFAPALAVAFREKGETAYRDRLFALIASWSAASPIGRPGYALDVWNSRAVATRLMHWAVAGSILDLSGASEAKAGDFGRAIGLHGLFLRDNLELDLRGNHLFRDAAALVFAQTLVGGVPDALSLLEEQVREQVLPDGCHIERAPMYHAICLQDLLEVQLLLGDAAPVWLGDGVTRMAALLNSILLGDGDPPLLGDGWLGEIDCSHLLDGCREVAGELPPPAHPERHGGIVGVRRGEVRAVMRAGPHGPDYLLGHAHADLLSFDVSVGNRRLVTDTGTALYDPGPVRQHLRATAAHNTLQIDDTEQIEAWGSFRVGRRGSARVCALGDTGAWSWIWASADSFGWLPGRPLHQRILAVSESAVLILDAVTGTGTHEIASRLHLHPDRPDRSGHVLALGAEAAREGAPLHEHFGETREMTRLTVANPTDLPWLGGWWIGCGEVAADRDSAAVECDLHMNEGIVRLELHGDVEFAATWNLSEPGGAESFVLCSPERESAT